MKDLCIEDALRALNDRLAMSRLFLDSVAVDHERPSRDALSGLADVTQELLELVSAIKDTLPIDALFLHLTEPSEDEDDVVVRQATPLPHRGRKSGQKRHRRSRG